VEVGVEGVRGGDIGQGLGVLGEDLGKGWCWRREWRVREGGVIAKDGMDDVEVVGMGDRGGLSVAVDRVDVDVGRISVESCEVDGDACE